MLPTKIIESLWLEKNHYGVALQHHLVLPFPSHQYYPQTMFPDNTSNVSFKTPRKGDSSISLGNLFQCLSTLFEWKFLVIIHPTLTSVCNSLVSLSLCPSRPVFLPRPEKEPWPSPSAPCPRQVPTQTPCSFSPLPPCRHRNVPLLFSKDTLGDSCPGTMLGLTEALSCRWARSAAQWGIMAYRGVS